MTVLLIFILPVVFVLYAVFSRDASGTFTAYLIGLFAGLASLMIVSIFHISGLTNSSHFFVHVFRFFLDYFFLHSIFGLAIFFLISFAISGEVLDTAFSALFGIFSIVFGSIAYNQINIPDITELVLCLLLIIGAILIFDFLFNILVSSLTLSSDFIVFLIASVSLFLAFFVGSIGLASYYLTSSIFTGLIISGVTCLLGIILNAILSRLS